MIKISEKGKLKKKKYWKVLKSARQFLQVAESEEKLIEYQGKSREFMY